MGTVNNNAAPAVNNSLFSNANIARAAGYTLAAAVAAVGAATIALFATQGSQTALTNLYHGKNAAQIAYGVGAAMIGVGAIIGVATFVLSGKLSKKSEEKTVTEAEKRVEALKKTIEEKRAELDKASAAVNGKSETMEAFHAARKALAEAEFALSSEVAKQARKAVATKACEKAVEFRTPRMAQRADNARIQEEVLKPFVEAHLKKIEAEGDKLQKAGKLAATDQRELKTKIAEKLSAKRDLLLLQANKPTDSTKQQIKALDDEIRALSAQLDKSLVA
jgi:hypothetical protein